MLFRSQETGNSTSDAKRVSPEKKIDASFPYTNEGEDRSRPGSVGHNLEASDADGSCVGIGEIYDLYVGDVPPKAAIEDFDSSYGDVLNNN